MLSLNKKTSWYAADRNDFSAEGDPDYEAFEDVDSVYEPPKISRRTQLQLLALWIVLLAETVAVVLLAAKVKSFKSVHAPNLVWSPVQHLVSYRVKTFTWGRDELSSFQKASSEDADQMWEDLYGTGMHKLTKQEASMIPNKTSAIPGDPDGSYIAEIDVFYQLQCLNKIRKALHPKQYPDMAMGLEPGVDRQVLHCVDSVRQSLICNADYSTMVWKWDEKQQITTFFGDVAHTCRDFEAILDWARERSYTGEYHPEVSVEDDIVIPIYNSDGTSFSPSRA